MKHGSFNLHRAPIDFLKKPVPKRVMNLESGSNNSRSRLARRQPFHPCFIRAHPWLKIDMQSAGNHLHRDHGDCRKKGHPQ